MRISCKKGIQPKVPLAKAWYCRAEVIHKSFTACWHKNFESLISQAKEACVYQEDKSVGHLLIIHIQPLLQNQSSAAEVLKALRGSY